MKKAAAFIITAFYLLLTSGMFVCALHCTTAKLFAKPEMQMAVAPHSKKCDDCRSNSCCKKHGNFVIKENFKPGYDIHFPQTSISVPQLQLPEFLLNSTARRNITPQTADAPPGWPGKSIAIKFHSLLI
jgi:hypothetical protein